MTALGKLEKVALRDVWKSEPGDFTPWLAQEENLQALADAIGFSGLDLKATEQSVGRYYADIVCENMDDNTLVVIENQYEKTDHDHLGKLLTYAAGLDAMTVIWIAEEFNDSHRAVLDWLNRITDKDFRVFGIEMELWKIDDSLPSPRFNIVCKPNESSRAINKATKSASLSESEKKYLEYWEQFKLYLSENKTMLRPFNPYPRKYLNFPLNKNGFMLGADLRKSDISVYMIISNYVDFERYSELLERQKNDIENSLSGIAMEWKNLGRSYRVTTYLPNANFRHSTQWKEYFVWMKDRLERFDKVFRPIVNNLNLDDLDSEEQS
ncbi:MAG: DUF4268 domain-containing protein [Pseudomonadota bacterium]